jgi:hypothetical protein
VRGLSLAHNWIGDAGTKVGGRSCVERDRARERLAGKQRLATGAAARPSVAFRVEGLRRWPHWTASAVPKAALPRRTRPPTLFSPTAAVPGGARKPLPPHAGAARQPHHGRWRRRPGGAAPRQHAADDAVTCVQPHRQRGRHEACGGGGLWGVKGAGRECEVLRASGARGPAVGHHKQPAPWAQVVCGSSNQRAHVCSRPAHTLTGPLPWPLTPRPQALENNSTLEVLTLHENNIGAAGCQALIGALQSNRTLRQLEFLPGNSAPPADAKALARAVKRNRK